VISVVDPMDRPAPTQRRPPQAPRWLFKVVDVVTETTIVDDASASATVAALGDVDSIFDVSIYVWVPAVTSWRQLTPGEHRILWEFRGR
jgi:hypothetical protein